MWADLANDDAAKAYQAVGTLGKGGKDSVSCLKEQLQSASVAAEKEAKHLARLLADLDDSQFSVCEKASKELEKLGEQARPALNRVLAGHPSPEEEHRVQALLAKLPAPAMKLTVTAEQLRIQRAVTVLEQIGSPEAKDLLETLSKGTEWLLLTEEARAARQRLNP